MWPCVVPYEFNYLCMCSASKDIAEALVVKIEYCPWLEQKVVAAACDVKLRSVDDG